MLTMGWIAVGAVVGCYAGRRQPGCAPLPWRVAATAGIVCAGGAALLANASGWIRDGSTRELALVIAAAAVGTSLLARWRGRKP